MNDVIVFIGSCLQSVCDMMNRECCVSWLHEVRLRSKFYCEGENSNEYVAYRRLLIYIPWWFFLRTIRISYFMIAKCRIIKSR